jgi:hypothetical protein
MTAFWNIASCSFVEIDRRFRGVYCLHHQEGSDGGSTQLWRYCFSEPGSLTDRHFIVFVGRKLKSCRIQGNACSIPIITTVKEVKLLVGKQLSLFKGSLTKSL